MANKLTKDDIKVREQYLWSKARDVVQINKIVDGDLADITVIIPSTKKKVVYRRGAQLLVYIKDLKKIKLGGAKTK